ncbi:MAG: 7-cyano-7-deazaguanine synthase [Pirellulales bacterium]|nr:7-cyano-7-deazaguanine synthase [Pirellulales bacterium]
MALLTTPAPVGLLLSGGLDSSILLGYLLRQGRRVQPFYVRTEVAWQREELRTVRKFCAALASPRLEELVELELPLADLYEGHWSVTGEGVPDVASSDDAVYLPGRNALLAIKAAVWCQLHGIEQLALGVLGSNPFADAGDEFFFYFESALNCGAGRRVRIVRPFAHLGKEQVMALGWGMPLEATFSCISPADGLHCGRCNKCGERMEAFRLAGREDPTRYAPFTPVAN